MLKINAELMLVKFISRNMYKIFIDTLLALNLNEKWGNGVARQNKENEISKW